MDWIEYINGIEELEHKEALISYANNLSNNNYPVIFDFLHLSLLLGVNQETLRKIVNANDRFYRIFFIPKRSSTEKREISAPYPILAIIQSWIKINILEKIYINDNCYSYKKGISIVHNANVHTGKLALYKLDLRNFFPSVAFERVMSIFLNCGYSYKVSYYLASLCTLSKGLPQGAITSPDISNIVCKRLDRRIVALSKLYRINYSRYADDMNFSGDRIPRSFIKIIKEIIDDENFKINDQKEKLIIGKRKKKIVTGISITNDKLSLPRKQKREIKLDVFKLLKYGYKINPHNDNFDPIFPERMLGKLYYWKQIERENIHIDFLIKSIKSKYFNTA